MVKSYRKRALSAAELFVWRLVFVSVAVFFGMLASLVFLVPVWMISHYWGGT